MQHLNPLVSCICITNNRPLLLRRAVSCFLEQDYPNCELVISYPDTDVETKSLIKELAIHKNLSLLAIERKNITLGQARNEAIRACNGSYVCIWDDDDWHHPNRISHQITDLLNPDNSYEASILKRIFFYDHTTDLAYLSFPYTWDGTLMCKKGMLLHNEYAHRNYGEDTHIVPFLEGRKLLLHIGESPFLYVYIYHGNNTWPYEHYQYFLKKSTLLNKNYTHKVQMLLK